MSPFELGMWEVLQHMKPSRYADGTHICSDHYDIDGRLAAGIGVGDPVAREYAALLEEVLRWLDDRGEG